MAKIKLKKKRLTVTAILFLLTFAVTALVRVRAGILDSLNLNAGVYATLGDVFLYIDVLILGGPWGAGVAAVAMALADLVVGSTKYIIGTLLIKSGMAFFIAAFCTRCDSWLKCFAVAAISEAIMVAGYLVYDAFIVREFVVAGKAFFYNLGQGVVCAGLGGLVLRYLPPIRPKSMPNVRRPKRREEDDGYFDYES